MGDKRWYVHCKIIILAWEVEISKSLGVSSYWKRGNGVEDGFRNQGTTKGTTKAMSLHMVSMQGKLRGE